MQNEPNLQKAEITVNAIITTRYENNTNWTPGENEPKTNPIQTKTNPIKPNSKPIKLQKPTFQNQTNPISNPRYNIHRQIATEEVAEILTRIQAELPNGQPYLLIPPERYQHMLYLKKTGELIDRVAKAPDGNHNRNWLYICKKAGVEDAKFHDLRATCITEWFEQEMMPHEVQKLAGHSSIDTTMRFYVGIRDEMIDKARRASQMALGDDSVTVLSQQPKKGGNADVVGAIQILMKAGVIKIGATGLEPATS